MLEEGEKAPPFSLPSDGGETVALEDYLGKQVVVYFYPRDMTPGCTTEALDFTAAQGDLEKKNAVVLGISKDSVQSHEKFRDKHRLNFPLLSDPEGEVLEKYGAWGEKNMYGKKSMGIIRTTVVVDETGTIKKVFPKVRVKGHVDKVLEVL